MDVLNKYLTEPEKARELEYWDAAKISAVPDSEGQGGKGFPDSEIIPLCDALNAVPGICTLQSCGGHGPGDPGHLWLWLDREKSGLFDVWGHVLAHLPGIDGVHRKYTQWGQEVVAIRFNGRLDEASTSVLLFFSALAWSTSSCDKFRPGP